MATRPQHGARKVIIVHHAETGIIHHVVKCFAQDMDKQHQAYDGHTFADITAHPEANTIHPDKHVIDVKTGQIMPRVHLIEHHRDRAIRKMSGACEAAIHGALLAPGDFAATRQAHLDRLTAVTAKINAAPDESSVKAIKWEA